MPLNFPNVGIATSRFGLKRNQASFESEFSKKISTQTHAGGVTDRWEGLYTTAPLTLVQAREFKSFLTQLKGQIGTFEAFDPDKKTPSTLSVALRADSTLVSADTDTITVDADDLPGNGKVNGASQTGREMATKDWSASATVLKAGDYFQVDTQLFLVTEDVISDASGNSTINFEPPMRTSPADNADVITSNPVMVARLSNPTNQITIGPVKAGPVSIAFEEAIK